MLCVGVKHRMVQRLGHYGRMSKNDRKHLRCGYGEGRVKWTNKIKKCSCARKSGRRQNNAGTDKEEKKLAGSLVKKNCLLRML